MNTQTLSDSKATQSSSQKEPRLRTVKFKGHFKKIFGSHLKIKFDTLKDLCEILSLPLEWRPRLKKHHVATFSTDKWIEDDLEDLTIITMMPPLYGSKGMGVFQIIVGVILIIVAIVLMFFLQWQIAIPLLIQGLGMVAGGLYELMMSEPVKEDQSSTDGYSGMPKSTVNIGTPIPVLFGLIITGGHLGSYFATTSSPRGGKYETINNARW